MFSLKKKLFIGFALFSFLSIGYSQVSIGQLSIDNSLSSAKVISTKYGDFTVKEDTPVEYYDSGAVKSLYIEGDQKIFIEALGEINICSPLPSSKMAYDTTKPCPILFYENGNIKSTKLASTMPDKKEHLKIKLEKYKDEVLECRQGSYIDFYESGKIKSFYVTYDQSLNLIQTMAPASKNIRHFKMNSQIELYEDGSLKTFTPAAETNFPNALALNLQNKPITLAKNSTTLISFYPASNSKLKIGENIAPILLTSNPVVLSDDATKLREVSWKYDTSFRISNMIFHASEDKPCMNTVTFNDKGFITKVEGILQVSTSFLDGDDYVIKPFYTEIDGKLVSVTKIFFDDNGNLQEAVFKPHYELSSKEVKDSVRTGTESLEMLKLYYKDGKKIAGLGFKKRNFGNSFYDTAYNSFSRCIFLFTNNEVSKIIELEEFIDENSEIYFDDKGKASSYKAKDKNKKVVNKKL